MSQSWFDRLTMTVTLSLSKGGAGMTTFYEFVKFD